MVAPMSGFYSNPELGKKQVRIAYVLKKEDLIRAVHILKEAIQVYNSEKKHLILKSADNENA